MKELKTQENNSKLKQKTQVLGKFPIFVFLNPTKIDSKTAEISIKCQICIGKFKIDLKRACFIGKLVEFFKNWMEHSEKLQNSSEKFKTQAKKLRQKTQGFSKSTWSTCWKLIQKKAGLTPRLVVWKTWFYLFSIFERCSYFFQDKEANYFVNQLPIVWNR